uniref:Uncharacterized protein n=1 Tax=Rhizophora mucronata TaxID=61149 RepID=A0A2P2PLE1_RHIMU
MTNGLGDFCLMHALTIN